MFFIPIYSHHFYEQKIKPILADISTKKYDIEGILDGLRKMKLYSSSIKEDEIDHEYKESYSMFRALYPQNEIQQIFALMANFILKKQNDFKKLRIKILEQGQNTQVRLNKSQIIFLLTSMALNIVPTQQYANFKQRKQKFCLTHSFSFIFSEEQYKTKTIISYFQFHFQNQTWKQSVEKEFTIRRKCEKDTLKEIIKKFSKIKLKAFELRSNNQSIEDFKGQGKIDFANQYIGGGALYSGCVQEEIMFANHPELYTSMILCEVMAPNQSIFLEGFRQFSNNKGYGFNTTFDQDYKIDLKTLYSTPQYIVAIDAYPFFASLEQFKKDMIDRQLLKAYSGFSNLPQNVNVVTGNWGCGVFGGDVKLKFIIQWLACSMSGKTMIYCPFGEEYKITQNAKIIDSISKKTVGQVYNILIKASDKIKFSYENIFEKMKEQIGMKK